MINGKGPPSLPDFGEDDEDLPSKVQAMLTHVPPSVRPIAEYTYREHRWMMHMAKTADGTLKHIQWNTRVLVILAAAAAPLYALYKWLGPHWSW